MFGRWSPAPRVDQVRSRKYLEEEGLHEELEERFRKTFYYGELPDEDCPSLPLSNFAVKYFKDSAPRGLGQVDMSMASSLAEDTYISPGSLVTSMIYAKRLRSRNSDYLQKMSSSDLFFISVMMASKYMYDEGVDEEVYNDEWAEAANLDIDEVNHMEREFLSAMDWQLNVSRSEFLQSVEAIERRIAWTQGCTRGWLSYTDMNLLWHTQMTHQLWQDIAQEWLKVVTVSSAAYLAGLLTMVGSTALAIQLSTSMAGYVLVTRPQVDLPIGTHGGAFDGQISGGLHPDLPQILPPSVPDLASNVSEVVLSNASLTHEDQVDPEGAHQGLLETVLPQLWAVVAFKDKFVQLMCAFSGSLNHAFCERNLKKIPSKCCREAADDHAVNKMSLNPSSNSAENPRLQHPKSVGQCRTCPVCRINALSKTAKKRPTVDDEEDICIVDVNRLKSDRDFGSWCSFSNRPPDQFEVNLDLLQYQDIVRGFTTSVPVAA